MTPAGFKPNALAGRLAEDEAIKGFDDETPRPRIFQGERPALRNWKISTQAQAEAETMQSPLDSEAVNFEISQPLVSTKASGWQQAIQYSAVFITVSWLTYAAIYIYSMQGGAAGIFSSPLAFGSIAATIMSPVALLWLCLSTWQRRTDAHLYAESLRLELQRLLFPTKDQAQAINSDIQLLVQQAAEISATSRGAIKAIQRARQGLRTEIRDFAGVSQKTEFHIDRLAETLHKRAEHLLSLTGKIEERAKIVNAEVAAGVAQWSDTSEKAFADVDAMHGKFSQAGERLENQAKNLKDLTSDVSSEAGKLEEILGNRIAKLEVLSRSGVQSFAGVSDGLEKLNTVAESLFTRSLKVQESLSNQVGVIRQATDHLSARISDLETVGNTAADKLGESLSLALSGSETVVTAVRRAREQLEKAASETAHKAEEIIVTTDEKLSHLVSSGAVHLEKVQNLLGNFDFHEKEIAGLIGKLSDQNDNVSKVTNEASCRLKEAADILDKSSNTIEERAGRPVGELRAASDKLAQQIAHIEDTLQSRIGDVDATALKARATAEEIAKSLKDHTSELSMLSGQISGQSKNITAQLDEQRGDFARFVDENDGKVESLHSRIEGHAQNLKNIVSETEIRIQSLGDSLADKGSKAISDIQGQTISLSELEARISDRLENLASQTLQTQLTMDDLQSSIKATSDTVLPLYEQSLSKAADVKTGFDQLHEHYGTKADNILARLREVESSIEGNMRNLSERAESTSTNLQSLAENVSDAAKNIQQSSEQAADRLQQVQANLHGRAEDLQILTDQTKLRTENLQNALEKQVQEIVAAVGHATTHLDEATGQFGQTALSIEENAQSSVGKIETATRQIMEEGQRLSSVGEQALHKSIRIVAAVQDESEQLVDKSREALTELQRASDSLQIRARQVEEYSKAALNTTRSYSDELKNQVEVISQTSVSASDMIADALSNLTKSADEADQSGNKIVQRLKFARDTLSVEAERFETITGKALSTAEETTGKFSRQSQTMTKAVGEITEQAEKMREIQLRNQRETFLSSAKFVIESLHSLAIDVSRHLESDIDEKSWKSYQRGDVAVFTRRLVQISAQLPMEKTRRKYAEDSEFRNYAQRYIRQFEELFEAAQGNDYGELLIAIFTSSDVGKLYAILCEISGRSAKTH